MVDGSVVGNAINHGSAEPLKAGPYPRKNGAPKRPGNWGTIARGPRAGSMPKVAPGATPRGLMREMAVQQTALRVGLFTECYRPIVNGVVASVDALAEGLRPRGEEV